ncbi:hypothetical protein VTN31DRAFT_1900 [Thermomyces dupontii]|uniref:uncharacterized protein n=1 Tax=Talaromyces thermophilus TaxID=28565 RepID=UPI0037421CD7
MDLKDPRSSFPEFTDPPTVRRAPQRASPNDIEMGDADLYIRLPQVEDDAASIRNEAHNPHSDVMGDMFQSAQGDRRPTPAPGGVIGSKTPELKSFCTRFHASEETANKSGPYTPPPPTTTPFTRPGSTMGNVPPSSSRLCSADSNVSAVGGVGACFGVGVCEAGAASFDIGVSGVRILDELYVSGDNEHPSVRVPESINISWPVGRVWMSVWGFWPMQMQPHRLIQCMVGCWPVQASDGVKGL